MAETGTERAISIPGELGEDAEFRPIRAEPKWGLLLGLAALTFVLGRM